MLLTLFLGVVLSQFSDFMSKAEPELELRFIVVVLIFCLFVFSHSLHHIILLRYVKLNQINGNLRSLNTVPNSLFIVLGYQLNILSSLMSDIVNHRKRVL